MRPTMTLKRSVLCLLTISVIVSWSGYAAAEPRWNDAQADSLMWDIQYLETRLIKMEAQVEADSLVAARVIESLEWELQMSRDKEMRWYQSPTIHFLFGAAAATLVMATTLNLSF